MLRTLSIAVICIVGLMAGKCESGAQARFDMQRVPKYYRDCVSKVVTLPTGAITRNEAVALLAKVRASELRLSSCGKATIKWADAQVDAYMKATR